MTREEAIAWLRARSVRASARDWIFGETIFVPVGDPTTEAGITWYRKAVYLYPQGQHWCLLDCDLPDPAREWSTLEDAVQGVLAYIGGI